MELLVKAVGRRKEAVAQVQIKSGTGQFIINNKPAQDYLQNDFYSLLSVKAPFDVLYVSTPGAEAELTSNTFFVGAQTDSVTTDLSLISSKHNLKFDTIVKVKGGGLMGQTEAIRLGISRAICLLSTNIGVSDNNGDTLPILNALDIRKQLKDKGYLTQDSRVKERRKYGLKKARKASQYHKR
uniref:Small ribosomal subunit protein uS9c n=1 Tax=Astrephomene gubernaculifera TaxID=47775 RepID=A0A7R6ZNT5_9CHLO|nr:ribosomal protein S9 [Astrephomene gubernaculifera]